jgi:hypothetical protein
LEARTLRAVAHSKANDRDERHRIVGHRMSFANERKPANCRSEYQKGAMSRQGIEQPSFGAQELRRGLNSLNAVAFSRQKIVLRRLPAPFD